MTTIRLGAFSACSLILLAASPAFPATAPVIFNGTVDATCTLNVTQNGTLDVSANLQTLSSEIGTGQPGQVSLTTTGGVQLSVDAVTDVTPPAADATPTTWTPTYSSSGATNFAQTGLANDIDEPGDSTVTVHLAGTKSGSDRFAAGNYTATVTVRCE